METADKPQSNEKDKRPFRGNQWTKRRGEKTAADNAERWQANPRFSAAALIGMLRSHATGRKPLSATQVKAVEIMLDRVAPRLSAVEQTTIEPAARLSEAEIRAQLAELVANHGGLLQELIAEHARRASGPVTTVDPAQSDSTEQQQVTDSITGTHG